jgi:gliding motility-associated-like protein
LDSICSGDSLLLVAEDAVTYSWIPVTGLSNPLIATPVASPTASTLYIVTGVNAYGCSSQDSTLLLVYYPPITDVQPDTAFICFGDSIALTASGGVSYAWQPDPELNALNISQPIARPQDTSTYVVVITNIHGCSARDSVTIPVQLPVTAFAPSPFNACVGVPLQLTAGGGLYYLWTPPSGLTNPAIANPIATPDSNISYLLIVSNDCFTDSTNVDVIIHPLPEVYAGEDTLIYGNTSATLNGTTNGISWFWYPGTHLDNPFDLQTFATPPASESFYLFAISEYGCQNIDSVFIVVNPDIFLIVPTAFSPNADGKNDLFRIVRYFNIRALQSFSVWNRWGEKVWETQDLNSGWDGTFRGSAQPVDTYIWKVEASSGNGKRVNRSGEMTLIR